MPACAQTLDPPWPKRRRRDDGHRHRRELERGEEAGKPRADNDDAAARSASARNALAAWSLLTSHIERSAGRL